MAIEFVLDASALCALLLEEPGAEAVARILSDSVISVVNLSEVYAVLIRRGTPSQRASVVFSQLGIEVVAFDESLAFQSAELEATTRRLGLSLGDRVCVW